MTTAQIILSLVALPILYLHHLQHLAIIFLLIDYILSTIGSTLIYPAEEKILPAIVGKTKLAKINGLFQMTYRTLDLFLDALATALITYLSLSKTMIISAIIFAMALIFYAKLVLPKSLLQSRNTEYFTDNYLKDLIKGWQILKNEGRILILIIPFAITNLFYGIASIGLPYFASHYLTTSAISYGSLEFASSVGGLIGSLIISRFNTSNKLERLVTICLFLAGISIIFEVLVAQYSVFLILIFALGNSFWISIMNINFEVLVQESFSPHILGRVETINSSIINSMIPIGSFLGGIIVQHCGSNLAIILEGLAEVFTAIFYLLVFQKNK